MNGGDPFALECKKKFNTKLKNSGTNRLILTRRNQKKCFYKKNCIKPFENDEKWPKTLKTIFAINKSRCVLLDEKYFFPTI